MKALETSVSAVPSNVKRRSLVEILKIIDGRVWELDQILDSYIPSHEAPTKEELDYLLAMSSMHDSISRQISKLENEIYVRYNIKRW